MWTLPLLLFVSMFLSALPFSAMARPERIRPGYAYYSDDYQVEGGVHDLAGEKNYEEVYRFYNYYEAVYNDAGQVVIFRTYKQGKVIRTEEYRYGPDGRLLERILKRPGQPAETILYPKSDGS